MAPAVRAQTAEPGFASALAPNAVVTGLVPTEDGRWLMTGSTLLEASATSISLGAGLPLADGTSRRTVGLDAAGAMDPVLTPAFSEATRLVAMPDGTILDLSGIPKRWNPDGTLQRQGSSILLKYGTVGAFVGAMPQADGGGLIFGDFSAVNGVDANGWIRIDANGRLDDAFRKEQLTSPNPRPKSVATATLPDGSVLLAGEFSGKNNSRSNGWIRVTADGKLAMGFQPLTDGQGSILTPSAMLGLPDGHFLAAFSDNTPGISGAVLRRYDANGIPDAHYPAVTFEGGVVSALALQPDGQLLVGGAFTSANGTARSAICRLDGRGIVDPDFHPDVAVSAWPGIVALGVQRDGRVVIGGFIRKVGGVDVPGVARVKAFDPVSTAPAILGVTASQRVPIGTAFRLSTTTAGFPRPDYQWYRDNQPIPDATNAVLSASEPLVTAGVRYHVVVANTAGNASSREIMVEAEEPAPPAGPLDTARGYQIPAGSIPMCAAADRSNRIVMGFMTFTPVKPSYKPLIRVNSNGLIDEAFQANVAAVAAGMGDRVSFLRIGVQPDNQIVALVSATGQSTFQFVRIHEDGTRDTAFPATPLPFPVAAFACSPDGGTVALLTVKPATPTDAAEFKLIRLRPDGTIDLDFDSGTPLGAPALVVIRKDGRIYAHARTPVPHLVRLLSNGKLDADFTQSTPAAATTLAVMPDGRLIGLFDNSATTELRRLLPDGQDDGSYRTTRLSLQPTPNEASLAVLPNGEVVTAQGLVTQNGRQRGPWLHFWEDGQLDSVEMGPATGATPPAPQSVLDTGVVVNASGETWLVKFPMSPNTVGSPSWFAPISPSPEHAFITPRLGSGEFTLRIPTIASRTYQLERTSSLDTPVWSPASAAEGDGLYRTFRDSARASGQVYYRVIIR